MTIPYFEFIDGIAKPRFIRGQAITKVEDDIENWHFKKKFRTFACSVLREIVITDRVIRYLKDRYGDVRTQFKINLTGPATLMWGINENIDRNSIDEKQAAVEKLAEILVDAIQFISENGLLANVHHIQIDEPILSEIDYDGTAQNIVEIINGMVKAISERFDQTVSVHVCGKLNPDIVRDLAIGPLDIFDLELSNLLSDESVDNRSYLRDLRDVVAGSNVENWAVGCIDSSSHRIESTREIETILSLLREQKTFDDKYIFKPDCGLRGLTLNEARQKLTNFLDVANEYQRIIEDERAIPI